MRGFLLLALASLRDEVCNILLHVWPIEAFSGQTNNTVYPKVSHITSIVLYSMECQKQKKIIIIVYMYHSPLFGIIM